MPARHAYRAHLRDTPSKTVLRLLPLAPPCTHYSVLHIKNNLPSEALRHACTATPIPAGMPPATHKHFHYRAFCHFHPTITLPAYDLPLFTCIFSPPTYILYHTFCYCLHPHCHLASALPPTCLLPFLLTSSLPLPPFMAFSTAPLPFPLYPLPFPHAPWLPTFSPLQFYFSSAAFTYILFPWAHNAARCHLRRSVLHIPWTIGHALLFINNGSKTIVLYALATTDGRDIDAAQATLWRGRATNTTRVLATAR